MLAELHTLDLFLCILNVSSFIIVFSYWQFSSQHCVYIITLCCCVAFIIINMTISVPCTKIYRKINDMNMKHTVSLNANTIVR
jgi:ABC-type transport system involved in Fe-S cluster assembly fused permease/ATPase subunit